MAIDIESPGAEEAALRTALANLMVRAAFRVSKSSNQTGVASGTPTQVTFDTEALDIGGHFASNVWTPPAGLVILHAGAALTGNLAAAEQQVKIYKNGSAIRVGGQQIAAAGNAKPNCQLVDLADGDDTYEVYVVPVTSSSTATVTGTGASGPATYFEGICLGQ